MQRTQRTDPISSENTVQVVEAKGWDMAKPGREEPKATHIVKGTYANGTREDRCAAAAENRSSVPDDLHPPLNSSPARMCCRCLTRTYEGTKLKMKKT